MKIYSKHYFCLFLVLRGTIIVNQNQEVCFDENYLLLDFGGNSCCSLKLIKLVEKTY
jgi:hypothetical protein